MSLSLENSLHQNLRELRKDVDSEYKKGKEIGDIFAGWITVTVACVAASILLGILLSPWCSFVGLAAMIQ